MTKLTIGGAVRLPRGNDRLGVAAFRLPASGGAATANARNAGSTRSLAIIADQAGAVDLARVINASATITSRFAAPKATAGLHVSALTVSADGTAFEGYRDPEAVVTTAGAAGATEMTTLATSAGTGSTMLGAVLFTGAEHDAATVARYRQMIASRDGVTVT